LRLLMQISEEPAYSRDYLDADKRSIANAIQVAWRDGSSTERVAVEYPIGHRRRRADGIPLLGEKFSRSLRSCFPEARTQAILQAYGQPERLAAMAVDAFMDLFVDG
jgi:2-methylcitrate dehydratase